MSITHQIDLSFYHSGSYQCPPGTSYGPVVRDFYLIHFVRSGKGVFHEGGRVHTLHQGQGFLICPGRASYYQADPEDPWHYFWVGFKGVKAEVYLQSANLSIESPIFTLQNELDILTYFDMLEAAKNLSYGRDLQLLGGLYLLLSHIAEFSIGDRPVRAANSKELYIRSAIEYMERNYTRKMTIHELSNYIGLNRSYLCTVFKEAMHVSPKEFLTFYRMERACELLNNPELAVSDVGYSVGYDDPLVFSKSFTKCKGISPREYRKHLATKNTL